MNIFEYISKALDCISKLFELKTEQEKNREFIHYEERLKELTNEINSIKSDIHKNLDDGNITIIRSLMLELEQKQREYSNISTRLSKAKTGS